MSNDRYPMYIIDFLREVFSANDIEHKIEAYDSGRSVCSIKLKCKILPIKEYIIKFNVKENNQITICTYQFYHLNSNSKSLMREMCMCVNEDDEYHVKAFYSDESFIELQYNISVPDFDVNGKGTDILVDAIIMFYEEINIIYKIFLLYINGGFANYNMENYVCNTLTEKKDGDKDNLKKISSEILDIYNKDNIKNDTRDNSSGILLTISSVLILFIVGILILKSIY